MVEGVRSGGGRRTVTILFADLASSTELGERLDPEGLSRVMDRYFDAVATVVTGHGGTVEKYIGDAIMAVFGVPRLHEDDALRGVRSAVEIVEAVARLSDEDPLLANAALSVRIGLNTGDVVASPPSEAAQRLVTGDAVNVAARLQEEAAPGAIVLSHATYELVRDRVRVGPATSLVIRGKREPVVAYRVEELLPEVPFVRSTAALIGRGRELERLLAAFETAASGPHCELFTIIGPAGIGKSRLAWELDRRLRGRATVVRGRCLAYGQGVTFWPIAEIVHAIVGISPTESQADALARLEAFVRDEPHGEELADRLAHVVGLKIGSAPGDELYWSVRRLLEIAARSEPLVAVVDDIHWAEPTLLDLLDYVADWSRDAPILLLCISRPDLLEHRPTWGGGKRNASTLLLQPLDDSAEIALLDELAGLALPRDVERLIGEAAQGNPLFIEELFRMLVARGSIRREGRAWVTEDLRPATDLPATIQALLAARLDQLEPGERTVAQAAAVVGRAFSRQSLEGLVPEAVHPGLREHLRALTRKEILREEESAGPTPDRFRFRHDLIRDAAYGSLAKGERADLHARTAGWLETAMADRIPEYEPVIASHLDQAYRYRREIGQFDSSTEDIGRAAGRWLARAGIAANQRRDVAAAARLLSRAMELLDRTDPLWVPMLIEYGDAAGSQGDYSRAGQLLDDALHAATAVDPGTERRARLYRMFWRYNVEGASEDLLEATRELADESIDAGDDRMSAQGLQSVSSLLRDKGDLRSARTVALRAQEYAERSGDADMVGAILAELVEVGVRDPTPCSVVAADCRRLLEIPGIRFPRRASCLESLAVVVAMQGEFAEARRLVAEAATIDRDVGIDPGLSRGIGTGLIEQYAGQPAAAELAYRGAYEIARRIGDYSAWFIGARLARALADLGRDDEAFDLTVESEREDDGSLWTQTLWRGARARVLARRGMAEQAMALADLMLAEARRAGFADMPNILAGALEDAGAAARDAGYPADARRHIEEAIALYEAKGNIASARLARARLAAAPVTDALTEA